MDANDSAEALKSQLDVTAGVADRLAYSITRARKMGLVPLSMGKLAALSDDEMEILDAYIFRYGSLAFANRSNTSPHQVDILTMRPISKPGPARASAG